MLPLRFFFWIVAFGVLGGTGFGKDEVGKPPEVTVNFRLLAWPHPRSQTPDAPISPKTGEPTEVRFLSTIYYLEGNATKTLRLLPGKPSRSITYAGDPQLAFFRNQKLEGTPTFSISLDHRYREVLLLLYPKTSLGKTFHVFPVFRPFAFPGRGITVNLTKTPLFLSVDGNPPIHLESWKQKPLDLHSFLKQKDHVRLEVRTLEAVTTKPILSIKKFFERDESPILLLRRDFGRSKLSLTTL